MQEFAAKIEASLAEKRKAVWNDWHRILPTNELLFDRWEKAKLMQAGEGSSVYDSSVIMGEVKLGAHVWVGPFTVLEALNGTITIGDYCSISSGVQIFTHDSVKWALSGGRCSNEVGDVSIGSNTYIGGLSIISKNVKIGSCCVIGANSFVNADIPDCSIAFGSPARVVGKVCFDGEDIYLRYNHDRGNDDDCDR